MKHLALIALLLMASAPGAAPARYELDPEHLTLGFLVDHIGYSKVLGTFGKVTGSYTYDDATGVLSNVRIVVETDSVNTGHARRDQHLRSDDFLASGKFPRMTFTSRQATSTDRRQYTLVGELELRGIRKPVTLNATLNKSAAYPMGDKAFVMGVSARGTLKRSDFGSTYAVADGLVGDTVELIIEIEARRQ